MAKKLALVNGIPRMTEESASVTIYDETVVVGSNITTGTPVTLPNSGSYTLDELEIRLNGIRLDRGVDYNTVGASPPRTQVAFTFDLLAGVDTLNYRIDRPA